MRTRLLATVSFSVSLSFVGALASSAAAQPPPQPGQPLPPLPPGTSTAPSPAAQPPQPGAPAAAVPPSAAEPSPAPPPGAAAAPAPAPPPVVVEPGYDVLGQAGARAVGAAPPGTRPSDFMDTRLTWTFGDDDFLHGTGELIPLSPTFSVGDRQQYRLFFDSLNSRYAGRENLTHLVMYKKMPGFIDGLTTEAAVVLRFDMAALAANTGNLNTALYDAGSYIRLFYNIGAHANEGLSATFFPLDTDRFRLGYLYDISWGGTAASINQSIFPRIQGSAPGMKVQFDGDHWYGFAGFKTATIVQPQQVLNPGGQSDVETVRVGETNYGLLAGGGVDPLDYVRFEGGVGYFQQGRFDLDDVRGRGVYTYGGSARVVFHHDMPVPQSIDMLLYRNDPMAPMILFAPEKYDPARTAWSVAAEGALLEQHLKDFDLVGATTNQAAYAGALYGTMKSGYARLSVSGILRNLNYVERNVPGFIPFETLPANTSTDPEMFGAVAADYHFPGPHLTPGIGGGVQLPSTFRSQFREGGLASSRTIVVRSQGDESILPYNQDRQPIFQGRVSLRWDLSTILSAVAWLQYVRDPNATLVVRDPTEGTASLRVPQSADRLGAAVSLQARF
jgi:hypothetical protein